MIGIFAPCMRADVEPSNLKRARGARVVTTRHRKQSGRNTLCHQPPPPSLSHSRRQQQRRSRTSRWYQSALLWAVLSKRMHRALSSSSNYQPDQNDSSPTFATNRTWQPADMTNHGSLSCPNDPAVYLSSRLSSGGYGLAPITERLVPQHGPGGFTHYSEQLGVAAVYDASRGGGRECEHKHPPTPSGKSGLSNDSPFHSSHPHLPTRHLEVGARILQQWWQQQQRWCIRQW